MFEFQQLKAVEQLVEGDYFEAIGKGYFVPLWLGNRQRALKVF